MNSRIDQNLSKSYQLAELACELGIALWKAESQGSLKGEITAVNDFIFRLKNDPEAGLVEKSETALALIIVQIVGFTSSKELGNLEAITVRMKTVQRALEKISIEDDVRKLLKIMVSAIYELYFQGLSDASISGSINEELVVPHFFGKFFEAFEKYKLPAK